MRHPRPHARVTETAIAATLAAETVAVGARPHHRQLRDRHLALLWRVLAGQRATRSPAEPAAGQHRPSRAARQKIAEHGTTDCVREPEAGAPRANVSSVCLVGMACSYSQTERDYRVAGDRQPLSPATAGWVDIPDRWMGRHPEPLGPCAGWPAQRPTSLPYPGRGRASRGRADFPGAAVVPARCCVFY